MVKLCTSLFALTLAAGSALAFPDGYYRRSELASNLYGRGFIDGRESLVTRDDHEDLFGREVFDDHIEAREPSFFTAFAKAGGRFLEKEETKKAAKKLAKKSAVYVAKSAVNNGANYALNQLQGRGFEDDELFGRDLEDEEFFGREYDYLEERDLYDDLD